MARITAADKDKIMWICVAIGIVITLLMMGTEGTFV